MGERLTFGIHTSERPRHTKADQPATMFPDGEDLPLFSGTPVPAIERPFVPDDHSMKQGLLPGMPVVDYAHVLERDRALRRRLPVVLPPSADIFTSAATTSSAPPEPAIEPVEQPGEVAVLPLATPERRRSPRNRAETLHPLR